MQYIRRRGATAVKSLYQWIRANPAITTAILIGIAVRLYAFGDIPPGLNQDEAATGYDAWAVLHYGVDRNGFGFPVMFVSWGSGMYALNGYLAWPFMVLGGLNEITVRLPHLVLGVLSLWLMYLLALHCTNDRLTARLALFFLAINPWHIMISRWGLDSNLLPGFFLAGVTLLVLSLKRPQFLLWSAIVFALCLYLYGTAYVVVPLFVLLAWITLLARWRTSWKQFIVPGVTMVAVALPIVLFIVVNQFHWDSIELPFLSIPNLPSAPRYQTVSSLFSNNIVNDSLRNLLTFWDFLFRQNDEIWNSIPKFGPLYPIGLPFAFLGLLSAIGSLWKARGRHPLLFPLLWILVACVLAALQPVNINRINVIFLPLILFIAVGVRLIAQNKLVLKGVLAIFGLFFIAFTHTYFTKYPAIAAPAFFDGLGEALTVAAHETNDRICVTGNVNQAYIFALFYNRVDPYTFFTTVDYENPGEEFQGVNSFGRYTFVLEECTGRYGAYVVHRNERPQFENESFILHDFAYYSAAIPK